MKKIFLIIGILFIMIGCGEKEYIKEVISNKKVNISMRDGYKEKYLILNIPLEFNLNLNNYKINDVILYYNVDARDKTVGEDYYLINKKDSKIFLLFDEFEPFNYPKEVYLVEKKRHILKEDALKLIQKYNPTALLESIKTKNDTIPLISYAQFRKDHPEFLAAMRKISDTLILRMWYGGNDVRIVRKKINW